MNRHTSDQFRPFFPARPMPVSIDKSAQNESQRGKSQTSSFSQSQEYRSQATAYIGSSGQDSQVSIGGRYDDLLASGRHMEIKDAITALNRTTSLLAQNLNIIQATVISNTTKLEEAIKSVQEVRQTQEAYFAVVEALRQDVQGLQRTMESVTEQTRSKVKVTEECRRDESDEPLSPLSEGGISLTEYVNVKRMRIDRSVDAVTTDTRKRARSDALVSSAESRHAPHSAAPVCSPLVALPPAPQTTACPRTACSMRSSTTAAPSACSYSARGAIIGASEGAAVRDCEESAGGLLFEDF